MAYYPSNPNNFLRDVSGVTSSLSNIGNVASVSGSTLTGAQTNWLGGAQNVASLSQPGGNADGNSKMQYLSLPGITIGTSFTVWAWFYPTTSDAWARIFDIGNGAPGNNIILDNHGGTSALFYQVYATTTVTIEFSVNSAWNINTWNHACMAISGATIVAYYNANNAGTATSTSSFPGVQYPSGNGWIGRSRWGNYLYTGYIDELRIYNRALSAIEVASVYAFRGDTYTPVMPLICAAGTYTLAGASACTPCAAGTFGSTAGASACAPCPAGTYSAAGASVCTNCSAGQWSYAGYTTCYSNTYPLFALLGQNAAPLVARNINPGTSSVVSTAITLNGASAISFDGSYALLCALYHHVV
jgi:hypothetical protein